MKRFSLYIYVLLLSLAPAVWAAGSGSPVMSVLVRTTAVQERRIVDRLEAYGTIEPGPQQLREVAAPRASMVQVLVPSGAQVKRGEPLLSLSATPEAGVQYTQAVSQLAYARSALKHARSLFKEHLITRDQLNAAQKALTDAQANLAAQQLMGGKGPALLRAPADGVVTAETVASGAQVPAGTTLLTLAERGNVYARLGLDPGQVGRVKTGMPVVLHEVFDPQISRTTKITRIGGAVDPITGLVDVLVTVTGHGSRGFLPGTHVTGVIQVRVSRSLAVPRSAVLRDERGAYVFIVQKHVAQRVNVKTGVDDGTWVGVQGALHAGEQVVTLGNYELTNGMAVREQTP